MGTDSQRVPQPRSGSADGPLTGLRVLEISAGRAGRIAGMLLADLGADVVAVVPPGQSPQEPPQPADVCWGRGKRQLAASDADALALAGGADVMLVNVTPAEITKRALTSQHVRAVAPDVVHVWLPPYAETGEWCDLPDDPLFLAALTSLAVSLPADDTSPVAPVVSALSSIHGALGATAAVAAMVGKRRFGVAQPAVVTGLHAGGALMGTAFAEINDEPTFLPTRAIIPAPNWRPYKCADGKRVFLATLTPQLFLRALQALDRLDVMELPEVAGDFKSILDLRRGRNAVTKELEPVFAARSSENWLALFREARVPCALVQSREDWINGPVVTENDGRIVLDDAALGQVAMPNVPIVFAQTPGRVRGLARQATPRSLGWRDSGSRPRPSSAGRSKLPLDGVRVLDMSSFFAAPLASALLADFGADVVRVEPPTGDPYREYPAAFLAVNQRKRGLALDLAEPASRPIVHAMLASMDVLVENMRPAARTRLDLTDTSARYPQLVHCSVSAFGRAERFADMPGFDPIMQSLSGLSTAQGGQGEPVTTSAGVNDAGTGALSALGLVAALYVRERTSRGQRIWTSLAAASLFLQAAEFTTWDGSPEPRQGGQLFRGPGDGHRYYECADGWIAAAATDSRGRTAMLAALDSGDFSAAAGVLRGLSVSMATARLAAAGIPACRVVPRDHPLRDPFPEANSYSHLVPVPQGMARVVNHYASWPAATVPRPARYFDPGDDSTAILREFGAQRQARA